MEWEVLEHRHTEKTSDWRASVIIVAGAIVALMIFLGSYMIALLVIIATATTMLVAHRKPNMMHVILSPSGITAGTMFYPYNTLDGFAVVTHGTHHKIILESTKVMMPLIIIPAPEETDPLEIHMFLAQYLEEKDLQEPLPHLILERFGL